MTLFTILLVGCVDIKDEAQKYRQVNLSLLKMTLIQGILKQMMI